MGDVRSTLTSKLGGTNEAVWMRLGSISELMHDSDKATYSYENVLRHNPNNVKALTQIASICRLREQYPKAVDYFQRILNIENNNGEIWGALGHCYLMMDDLQKAYTAYQQALYHLPNPKDPNLWYGIGILYDRYGSFEHAEEAFTAVLKMDPKFEKSNEIYFRLGIIYKQQFKYERALECFRYILLKPPRPLTQGDIYFQIGHVYELQQDFNSAKESYEKVLKETPNHAKALQQLGWLYHSNANTGHQEVAIQYLTRSMDTDPNDGQTWYLLGRCYMAQQQYRKAYDAYQQAVYRDGRNPTFWCSIGVLYYQINQYRDALDAYSRAIRLNPYLSEVWYDLGTLYESCNQISDSLDAYQRAAELDPNNKHIQQRLTALREANNPNKTPGVVAEAADRGDKATVKSEKEKTPMTMEPRTHVERPVSPRLINQNIPAVADLVDLSSADEKRTLPSAHDLNSRNFNGESLRKDDNLDQYKFKEGTSENKLKEISIKEGALPTGRINGSSSSLSTLSSFTPTSLSSTPAASEKDKSSTPMEISKPESSKSSPKSKESVMMDVDKSDKTTENKEKEKEESPSSGEDVVMENKPESTAPLKESTSADATKESKSAASSDSKTESSAPATSSTSSPAITPATSESSESTKPEEKASQSKEKKTEETEEKKAKDDDSTPEDSKKRPHESEKKQPEEKPKEEERSSKRSKTEKNDEEKETKNGEEDEDNKQKKRTPMKDRRVRT